MAQSPKQTRKGQLVANTQTLRPLIAGLTAAKEELSAAWQIATSIPFFLSCNLSGVALRSSANGSWELALIRDGERLSARKRQNVLSDLDVLFEAAIDRDSLAIPDRSHKRRACTIPEGTPKEIN